MVICPIFSHEKCLLLISGWGIKWRYSIYLEMGHVCDGSGKFYCTFASTDVILFVRRWCCQDKMFREQKGIWYKRYLCCKVHHVLDFIAGIVCGTDVRGAHGLSLLIE